MKWVIGYIDNNENVFGRLVNDDETHTQSARKLRKLFRWSVDGQEFHPTIQSYHGIKPTSEEFVIIKQWLTEKGYKSVEGLE